MTRKTKSFGDLVYDEKKNIDKVVGKDGRLVVIRKDNKLVIPYEIAEGIDDMENHFHDIILDSKTKGHDILVIMTYKDKFLKKHNIQPISPKYKYVHEMTEINPSELFVCEDGKRVAKIHI